MKSSVKIFFILLLIGVASSCVKEGHVCYRFDVCNLTKDTPMTVRLSSWGGYTMCINDLCDSDYKFHPVETIKPHSSLMFDKVVGDHWIKNLLTAEN